MATTSRESLAPACLAVRDFPHSARLWFLRGQLIWLSAEDYFFSEMDYVTSILKAIELDPTLVEASESLASYYDGMKDDDERATEYISKAAALRTCLSPGHAIEARPGFSHYARFVEAIRDDCRSVRFDGPGRVRGWTWR